MPSVDFVSVRRGTLPRGFGQQLVRPRGAGDLPGARDLSDDRAGVERHADRRFRPDPGDPDARLRLRGAREGDAAAAGGREPGDPLHNLSLARDGREPRRPHRRVLPAARRQRLLHLEQER